MLKTSNSDKEQASEVVGEGEGLGAKQECVHSNEQLPFATSLLDCKNC